MNKFRKAKVYHYYGEKVGFCYKDKKGRENWTFLNNNDKVEFLWKGELITTTVEIHSRVTSTPCHNEIINERWEKAYLKMDDDMLLDVTKAPKMRLVK